MIDRRFGEGISEIVEVCRQFTRNEIEPVALEMDERHDTERMKAIWEKSMELGIPSLLIPEEYGGSGQTPLAAALVLDELAFGCCSVAVLFAHHLAACFALFEQTNKVSKEILKLISGEGSGKPAMVTLSFPSEVERENQPRLESSQGVLSLSGVAPLVGCAPIADYIVLFPREDSGADVSLVVVSTRSAGVSIGEAENMLGLNAVPFADVTFDNCELSGKELAGERGQMTGFLDRTLHVFYGFCAAIAMGATRSAFSKALQYAKDRYQFGKMIIEHHEIRRLLANMLIRMNMGTSGYIQAFIGEGIGSLASDGRADLAKIFCTDTALQAAVDAIQVHGGIGYMKETGIEKIMRDSKMLQVLVKSNRSMEVDVIG
jgi:acyl-CoA dehydrogenase